MDLYLSRNGRGGADHHRPRNGRMAAQAPFPEVSTKSAAMNERRAMVLVMLLSLGLWAIICALMLAIREVIMLIF
jgi:hypothetical protein